jgi:hypothetical protein
MRTGRLLVKTPPRDGRTPTVDGTVIIQVELPFMALDHSGTLIQ